eukprot:jgi/Chlat1/620/Chrsp103S01040
METSFIIELILVNLAWQLGDRVANMRAALKHMKQAGITVTAHSSLYQSAPAYVTEQPAFLNAAVRAHTRLPPESLLSSLKSIEQSLGRTTGGQRYGPRPIDLDIILYGEERVNREDEKLPLHIPHPRMQERDFVMAPLRDLLPPSLQQQGHEPAAATSTCQGLAKDLVRQWVCDGGEARVGTDDLRRVMPLGNGLWSWGQRTHVMGVLNVTPDSFSDGRMYFSVEDAVAQAERMAAEGADIIDIGGQSTRPGASRIPAEEELIRVLPVLQRIAASPTLQNVAISIDTFYSKVAEEAVQAGATIVNDVSAGRWDSAMLSTVAELGVPYAAMHSRGDPSTMQNAENTAYNDVHVDVARELSHRAEEAMCAGVEGWRLLLDPGLGFSKTVEGNLALLAGTKELRQSMSIGTLASCPYLLGPSRKGFLGKLTGRQHASERDYATAAAAAAAVNGGADIIRAHNVAAVRDAVRVADAIWRLRNR